MAGHRLEWRGSFDNRALNELHAEAFEHEYVEDDWAAQVRAHTSRIISGGSTSTPAGSGPRAPA